MSDMRDLIDRALNPRVHGADSDHCPACFGSCGAFPAEWAEDAEEICAALAKALEALLDKIEDRDGLANLLDTERDKKRRDSFDMDSSVLAGAVSAYLLGEETTRG